MTIFEYLSVAVSIVLSLAVVRLITGLPHLVAADKRYWVHSAWVLLTAVQIAMIWWNLWAYRQVEDWIFPGFVMILLVPSVVYFIAATLVPDTPANIESWRSHFFQVRRRFFLAYIFLFLCFFVNSWLLLQLPPVHPQRLGQALGIVLCSIGALAVRPRVHEILVSIALMLLPVGIALFFLRPGSMAPS